MIHYSANVVFNTFLFSYMLRIVKFLYSLYHVVKELLCQCSWCFWALFIEVFAIEWFYWSPPASDKSGALIMIVRT